jgi:murein DD-endopeptidase MepM/ murein hydrolase activator NlpD
MASMVYETGKSPRCAGLFLCVGMAAFLAVLLINIVTDGGRARHEQPLEENLETFRAFSIDASYLDGAAAWSEKQYRNLTENYLYRNGNLLSKESRRRNWYTLFLPSDIRREYEAAFVTVLSDAVYFPVAKDVDAGATVDFEDSWKDERNYGGKRRHEGTDLIPSVSERGYFPVVSVSDGIVEKKGWLKLGGYRIGIRANHGLYYYYAHLERYADGIEEKKRVRAGEIIGYMGDSGYGEEGTTGKFIVHLHFGIYLSAAGKEVSINPYHILRMLRSNQVAKPA